MTGGSVSARRCPRLASPQPFRLAAPTGHTWSRPGAEARGTRTHHGCSEDQREENGAGAEAVRVTGRLLQHAEVNGRAPAWGHIGSCHRVPTKAGRHAWAPGEFAWRHNDGVQGPTN
jgi:hypothetical protein